MPRKNIRLLNYDYKQSGDYFVTLCVHQKRCLFGEINNGEMLLNPLGHIAKRCWQHLSCKYNDIQLGEYIIMPNHMHGIIHFRNHLQGSNEALIPKKYKLHLGKILKYYKTRVAQRIKNINPNHYQNLKIWQKNYFERIIRHEIEYYFIEEYIKNNPRSWGNNILTLYLKN